MKIIMTKWYPQHGLFKTPMSGVGAKKDVDAWQQSLEIVPAKVGVNSLFKIYDNQHGYIAANFEVDKTFRGNSPRTVAEYSWRVDNLDTFSEAKVGLRNTKGIRCMSSLYVYRDETKMANDPINYSRPTGHYYTKPTQGRVWIWNYQIENNSL